MSRKRPSSDQVTSLLAQPHFHHKETQQEPVSTQATTPAPMLVDVDDIVPYDRNPRRTTNASYAEIKESIRATGMDQALTITQRPGQEDSGTYMIGAGGNTRLVALQELWQETGDERFRQVWCHYRPWRGDTNALLSHIRENDLRSDLAFIDRALAIQELRQLLEAELDRSLSQRELSDKLRERGYRVSRTMIRWYGYVVDTLHPLIPTVLQAGIGRPQIQRIHELQSAFGTAWKSLGLGEEASEAEELFAQTLQRLDNDILDIEALRGDLENELATAADCNLQRASLEVGAALTGSDGQSAPESPTPDAGADPIEAPVSSAGETGATQGQDTKTENRPPTSPTPPAAGEPSDDGTKATDKPKPPAPAPESDPPPPGNPRTASAPTSSADAPDRLTDNKSLRSRCWTLATRLAQGARLGDIVISIPAGLGFLVGPVPVDVQSTMHPDALRTAMCTWWQLATLAEQFARHGHACDFMPADWQHRGIGEAMRHARDSDQAFAHWQWTQADRELFNDVPGLEPNDIGPLLYQIWSDQRWADWVALVETTRSLYRQADDNPWRVSSCVPRSMN